MQFVKFYWWKVLAFILLIIPYVWGFINPVPRIVPLNETIRNLYFHVPMWFGMTLLLMVSMIFSIMYLKSGKEIHDRWASQSAVTGLVFGVLGICTGMLWALYTWGDWWTNDPKLNAAAIAMLIYFAYFVLRNSFTDVQSRARNAAVYNIFSFPIFVSLVYIMPRLTDSLHPGNGGNPGFNAYDRDQQMNIIFYSAVIGFILLGVWYTSIRVKMKESEALLAELNLKNDLDL